MGIHYLDFGVPKTDSFIYQCNILLDFIFCRWRDFSRSMIWLAIIGGGLINLHALLLLILKLKKRDYGVQTFSRLEIVIVNLALPAISKSSAVLIRGNLQFVSFPTKNNYVAFFLFLFFFLIANPILVSFSSLLNYIEFFNQRIF